MPDVIVSCTPLHTPSGGFTPAVIHILRYEFERMAGAVGFEPTIHDTKNRCLTTWPRPNPIGRCNLATKSVAIKPVLAFDDSKMWLYRELAMNVRQ